MELVTKGDNNIGDDRGLYAEGQLFLKRGDVIGRARGCVGVLCGVCVREMTGSTDEA